MVCMIASGCPILVSSRKRYSVEIINELLAYGEAQRKIFGPWHTKSVNQGSNLFSACLLGIHHKLVSVVAPHSQHPFKARCDFIDDPLNLIRPRQLVDW